MTIEHHQSFSVVCTHLGSSISELTLFFQITNKQHDWRRLRGMTLCKRIKLLMRSDNHGSQVCTNKQACVRKAIPCIKVATKDMWYLKGEVATDWQNQPS